MVRPANAKGGTLCCPPPTKKLFAYLEGKTSEEAYDATWETYVYPDGHPVTPDRLSQVIPFKLETLAARGFDPKVHVAVNLDHVEHVRDGHFAKVDYHGRDDKEWNKTDQFYAGLCWPNDEESGDWTMRNPEILTDEEFAARITEPHCESVVPGLHGPGFTAKGVYWPVCRAYDWWLGSQVIMIDVDDAPKNHPVTWERAQEVFGERGLRPCFVYDTGSCRCLDGTHQRFRIVFALDEVCTDAVAVANAIEGLRDVFGADPAIQRSSYLWGGKSVIHSDFGARMSIDELLDAVGRSRPEERPASDDDWTWSDDNGGDHKPAAKPKPRPHVTSGWDPFAGCEMSETFSRTDDNLREVADFPALVRRECQRARDIDACCDRGVTEGDERWPYRPELLTYGSNLSAYVGGNEMLVEQLGAAYEAHRGDPRWCRWEPAKWGKAWAHGMKRVPVCSSTCIHFDACDHLFTRLWRGGAEPAAGVLEAGPAEAGEASSKTESTSTSSQPKPRRWRPLKGLGEATDWMGDQKWVWDGWIPRGAVSCMFGMPGIGKNWIAQHVAQVVTGQQNTFLDGSPLRCETGEVLWIDYENEAGTTARRMRAGGFDPNHGILSIDLEDGEQSVPMLTAKAKDGTREICVFIEEALADHPDIRLVVIDSLFGGTHGVREKDSEFAAPLTDLTTTASRNDIAVLILHHPRKPNGTDSQDDTEVMVHTLTENDLRGTIAILGVIRSLIAIDRPIDSPARRIYLRKVSHAEGGSRRAGFTLEDSRVVPCDPPERARPERGKGAGKTDEVEAWLRQFLSSGPKLKTTVDEAAEAEQFSLSTVGTASRRIGVVKERQVPSDKSSPYVWRLPGTDPVMVPDPIYEQELFGEK